MRVFIDTNIFLDLLCRCERFLTDSLKVFDLAVDGKLELLISDLSIANITEKTSLLTSSMKPSLLFVQCLQLFQLEKMQLTRHLR